MIFFLLISVLIGILLIAVIEQQTAKYGVTQPSTILTYCACQCKRLFTMLGRWFAYISSFLLHVKNFIVEYLSELIPSLYAILVPIGEIIISPAYFLKGYIDYAVEIIKSSYRAFRSTTPVTSTSIGDQPPATRGRKRRVSTQSPDSCCDESTNTLLLIVGTLIVIGALFGVAFYYVYDMENSSWSSIIQSLSIF